MADSASNDVTTASLALILEAIGAGNTSTTPHYIVRDLSAESLLIELNATKSSIRSFFNGELLLFPDRSVIFENVTFIAENTYLRIISKHLVFKSNFMLYKSHDYVGVIAYPILSVVSTLLNVIVLFGLIALHRRTRSLRNLRKYAAQQQSVEHHGTVDGGGSTLKMSSSMTTIRKDSTTQQLAATTTPKHTCASSASATGRTILDFHILNLCFADLLVSIVHCGIEGIWRYYVEWPFFGGGAWLCKAIAVIRPIGLFAVSFIIASIALDRLLAVTKPLAYHSVAGNKRRARYMMAVSWLLALVCSLPQALFFRLVTHPKVVPEFRQCRFDEGTDGGAAHLFITKTVHAWIMLTTLYYIPMIIIFVCYTIIFLQRNYAAENRRFLVHAVQSKRSQSSSAAAGATLVESGMVSPQRKFFARLLRTRSVSITQLQRRLSPQMYQNGLHTTSTILENGSPPPPAAAARGSKIISSSQTILTPTNTPRRRRQQTQTPSKWRLFNSWHWRKQTRDAFLLSLQLVGAFVVCTAPYTLVYSYYLLDAQNARKFNPHIREVLLAFSASLSLINPIIYGRKIAWSSLVMHRGGTQQQQQSQRQSQRDAASSNGSLVKRKGSPVLLVNVEPQKRCQRTVSLAHLINNNNSGRQPLGNLPPLVRTSINENLLLSTLSPTTSALVLLQEEEEVHNNDTQTNANVDVADRVLQQLLTSSVSATTTVSSCQTTATAASSSSCSSSSASSKERPMMTSAQLLLREDDNDDVVETTELILLHADLPPPTTVQSNALAIPLPPATVTVAADAKIVAEEKVEISAVSSAPIDTRSFLEKQAESFDFIDDTNDAEDEYKSFKSCSDSSSSSTDANTYEDALNDENTAFFMKKQPHTVF